MTGRGSITQPALSDTFHFHDNIFHVDRKICLLVHIIKIVFSIHNISGSITVHRTGGTMDINTIGTINNNPVTIIITTVAGTGGCTSSTIPVFNTDDDVAKDATYQ